MAYIIRDREQAEKLVIGKFYYPRLIIDEDGDAIYGGTKSYSTIEEAQTRAKENQVILEVEILNVDYDRWGEIYVTKYKLLKKLK